MSRPRDRRRFPRDLDRGGNPLPGIAGDHLADQHQTKNDRGQSQEDVQKMKSGRRALPSSLGRLMSDIHGTWWARAGAQGQRRPFYAGSRSLFIFERVRPGSSVAIPRPAQSSQLSIQFFRRGDPPGPKVEPENPGNTDQHQQESEQAVAHLRQVIVATQLLGLKQMNTFVGRDWTRSLEDNWPRFLDTWKPLVEFAEQQNVSIGIENCPMLFTEDEWPGGKNLANSPEIWRRMFEAIPSQHFGINYDPSHMIWQQMDYLQPVRDFADRIFHVHAKDVHLDQQQLDEVGILAHPLKYHTPKLPGFGDVDWAAFVSVLKEVGYQGYVCVEVEDRDYEETLELRRQALFQSAACLQPLMNG